MSRGVPESKFVRARRDFIEGVMQDEVREFLSLADIGKLHRIPKATLYRRAKKDDWQGEKNRFQTDVEQQTNETRAATIASQAAEFDKNCLQIAQGLMIEVGRKIQRSQQEQRTDPDSEGLPVSSLRDMSHTLANAQKIGKLALGEAQEISKVAADVSIPDSFGELIRELDELANQKASFGKHTLQ